MITVDSVSKSFGSFTAVDKVSFSLEKDQIVGFVGPNGAGKSTLMRMLATYLHPTGGSMQVCGLDVAKDALAVRQRVGYLPGDTPLYKEMQVDRLLHFVGQAHGLSGKHLKDRMQWVVEACSLTTVLKKRVKECSTGFRKRIGLATALIHDPAVILLDEPTHGLDPLQVVALRELLMSLRKGRTILLSSHIISEVDAISDRLLIIHQGKLLADGVIEDLCKAEGLANHDMEGLFLCLVSKYERGEWSPEKPNSNNGQEALAQAVEVPDDMAKEEKGGQRD